MRIPLVFVSLALVAGCNATAGGFVMNDTDVIASDEPPGTDAGNAIDLGNPGVDIGSPTSDIGNPFVDTGNPFTDTGTDAASFRDVPAADGGLVSAPGEVYCYTIGSCSGGMPVCCDVPVDGGFTDTCIADPSGCPTTAHAYECDESADCVSGQVCCTHVTTNAAGVDILTGSQCVNATACGGAEETQLCRASTDCLSGTSCVAHRISGRPDGFCM